MADEKIIKKLEQLSEELEESLKKCNKKILRKSEADEIIKKIKEEAAYFLPKDSDAYRIFESRTKERFRWSVQSHSDYAEQIDCKGLRDMITILKEVLKEYTPDFLYKKQEKTEYYFHKGEVCQSKRRLFGIMKRAEKSLTIVDPYLDEEVFDYINSLDILLKIKLLTAKENSVFQMLYRALKKERNNIEIRKKANSFHDRFLIIDESEIWNIGCSINGFGGKDFTINKLINKDEIDKAISSLKEYWADGEKI